MSIELGEPLLHLNCVEDVGVGDGVGKPEKQIIYHTANRLTENRRCYPCIAFSYPLAHPAQIIKIYLCATWHIST